MGAPGQLAEASPPQPTPPSLSPGSLHPLWLAKGTEGGGRGTAEKTRVCGTAFEHRRSAAPLSETHSGGTAGRNARVYTATGSDAAVGTGRNRPHAHHGPPEHESAVGVGCTVVFPPPLGSRDCRRWFYWLLIDCSNTRRPALSYQHFLTVGVGHTGDVAIDVGPSKYRARVGHTRTFHLKCRDY